MFHLTYSKTRTSDFKIFLRKFSAASTSYAYKHLLHDCSSLPRTLLSYSNNRKNQIPFASPKHLHPSYKLYSAVTVPGPSKLSSVDVDTLEKQFVDRRKPMILSKPLQEIGINASSCTPGQYNGLICPSTLAGPDLESTNGTVRENKKKTTQPTRKIMEESLGLDCSEALAGPDLKSTNGTVRKKKKKTTQPTRKIIEESLGLEPLGSELLAYFAGRMISGETLRRNGVMQKRKGDQIAIAFSYRRNGELVSCKYRDIHFTKRFWQEANTEKIFYGLDDIKEASDIIIVEGEMDKFAMEEAGFRNCVSVPHGAPSKVSKKALPLEAEASRIILATDGDAPGQAFVEELAWRLGRDRCWRVHWPMKDGVSSMKDANEVLISLGVDAVRDLINKAELYQMHYLE